MTKNVKLAIAILVLATAAAAQQDFDKVQIETQQVTPGVHMLIGSGGNIGVSSGADGVLIIDDQYAPLTEKIRAAVAGISSEPIRFVINTHWHGDHTGGNEHLGTTDSVIVAHENVRRRLSTEQFNQFTQRRTPASPGVALPVVTFTEDVSFHVNGDELHVFHVEPAHTDGDSVIHWKAANVFHMGDLFFSGAYPYIDLASGGHIDGIIAAAERVLALANDDSRIIPGHGPLSRKADLAAYHDVLTKVRAKIQSEINAGKSLEQIRASAPTKAWDAQWGQGFIKGEQITEFVYRSLTNDR